MDVGGGSVGVRTFRVVGGGGRSGRTCGSVVPTEEVRESGTDVGDLEWEEDKLGGRV